jgi:hypothetical protein
MKIFINTITQYSPHVRIADVRNQNVRENVCSDIVCSFVVAVCWMDETALNLILFIAILIQEILQNEVTGH